jgi:hypothetical protein
MERFWGLVRHGALLYIFLYKMQDPRTSVGKQAGFHQAAGGLSMVSLNSLALLRLG